MKNHILNTKFFLIILFFYFSINGINAQSKIEVGIGGAINRSTLNIDLGNSTFFGNPGRGTGYNVSLRLAYKIEEGTRLSFSPGYKRMNARDPITFNENKSTFLEIPIEVQQALFNDFTISAGLSLSYLSAMNTNGFDFMTGVPYNKSVIDLAQRRVFINPKFGFQYKVLSKVEIGLNYEFYPQAIIEADPDGTSGFVLNNSFLRHSNIQFSIFVVDLFK